MHFGKVAKSLSILSFIFIVAASISKANEPNDASGFLVNLLTPLFMTDKPLPPIENSIKAIGVFDIYEANIRNFLTYASILLVLISSVLSVLSAFRNEHSLWYSIAIFITCFALMEINYVLAGVYTLICMLVIMNQRKWGLTRS